MRELSTWGNVCYIRQKEQFGLGHAVLTAKDIIGEEPFAVLLPDDIVDSKVRILKQMIEVYEQYKTNIIAVERVNRQDTTNYGIIEPKKISGHIYQVLGLTEKPEPAQAPSSLGVVGRYILVPQIFDVLEVTHRVKIKRFSLLMPCSY